MRSFRSLKIYFRGETNLFDQKGFCRIWQTQKSKANGSRESKVRGEAILFGNIKSHVHTAGSNHLTKPPTQ